MQDVTLPNNETLHVDKSEEWIISPKIITHRRTNDNKTTKEPLENKNALLFEKLKRKNTSVLDDSDLNKVLLTLINRKQFVYTVSHILEYIFKCICC
jgi:hypothetical protein